MELLIHEWITLAVQLAADEVEEFIERITSLKKAEMEDELPEICD